MAKKKRRKGQGKGSSFERELCKKLSLWWTDGDREDIFWRTAGSGARATVRSKQGKQTAGQHGDIAATDPDGKDFLSVVTIEMKRGYNKDTFQDLFDSLETSAVQTYEKWIAQAYHSSLAAESYSWMIITKRDRRIPIVICSAHLIRELVENGAESLSSCSMMRASSVPVRVEERACYEFDFCVLLLDDLLEHTGSWDYRAILERCE